MPKQKMGRPTVDNDVIKDVHIHLRFDKETVLKLDKLAKKNNMNRSEYLRQLIKKQK